MVLHTILGGNKTDLFSSYFIVDAFDFSKDKMTEYYLTKWIHHRSVEDGEHIPS